MNVIDTLEIIFSAMRDSIREDNIFTTLGISPESRLRTSSTLLFEALVDVAIVITDDDNGWIEWYVYENDLGSKAMEAGKPGNLKPITNARELLEVMSA